MYKLKFSGPIAAADDLEAETGDLEAAVENDEEEKGKGILVEVVAEIVILVVTGQYVAVRLEGDVALAHSGMDIFVLIFCHGLKILKRRWRPH